ncbi:tyrosine-type recombinase/integrase [Streptomyces halstedii]|uniref:tyrosine-type recombinase/integrase n=1 Tax=Streptomyces halstedii TaxID=1944 RepID=UPI00381AC971
MRRASPWAGTSSSKTPGDRLPQGRTRRRRQQPHRDHSRFRHTVGAQLSEGGAQIQTVMAILGHRNAQMSATYFHTSATPS